MPEKRKVTVKIKILADFYKVAVDETYLEFNNDRATIDLEVGQHYWISWWAIGAPNSQLEITVEPTTLPPDKLVISRKIAKDRTKTAGSRAFRA